MNEPPESGLGSGRGWLAAAPHRARDVVVGALTLIGAAAVLWGHRSSPVTAGWQTVVVLVSGWLAVIDFRQHRLPNRIVGPLAGFVTAAVFLNGLLDSDLERSLRAVGFGVGAAAVLLVFNLVGGLGMGDVKYGYPWATSVGWFGWSAISVSIMATTVAGGLVAVLVLFGPSAQNGQGRQQRLSYGPYMALGLLIGLVVA